MSFVFNGKRVRKSTETEDGKLAKRIYDKVKGQVAEGKWFEKLPGEDRTFKEMMEKYLNEHAIKKASYKSFRSHVGNLNLFLGDYALVDITPKLINEYKLKRKKDGVKSGSINRELATLKKAFNLALKEWEWVKENPASKVSSEEESNKRDRWLTFEEEDRLLEVCYPPWMKEIVLFALNTGMRLGEILALRWGDVDLLRKTVVVMKSKNKDRRTIPINKKVFDLLNAKVKVRSIKTDLVFISQNHSMIDNCVASKFFHDVAIKAQIQDFRFHDLRHTAATRMIQAGKDLYKVQRLLGHKSPMMTQRYAHHYSESLRDAVEVLDNHVTNQSHLPNQQVDESV
jgi:integrase